MARIHVAKVLKVLWRLLDSLGSDLLDEDKMRTESFWEKTEIDTVPGIVYETKWPNHDLEKGSIISSRRSLFCICSSFEITFEADRGHPIRTQRRRPTLFQDGLLRANFVVPVEVQRR